MKATQTYWNMKKNREGSQKLIPESTSIGIGECSLLIKARESWRGIDLTGQWKDTRSGCSKRALIGGNGAFVWIPQKVFKLSYFGVLQIPLPLNLYNSPL